MAVWDYELSQLLGICKGHSHSRGEITAIEFLAPYPVMVTAGLDSKVCLWAVRPTPAKHCYVSIGQFYNVSFNYTDDTRFPVKTLLGLTGDKLKGLARGQCMKHSQINAETYRDYKTNQVLATKETQVRIDARGNYRGLTQISDMRLKLLNDHLTENEATGQTKVEEEFERMRQAYLPRMTHLDPDYDSTVDEEKMRIMLYLGDDFGILKQWDLTYFIENSFVEACRPVWETRGEQYFPGRTESVNVQGYADRMRNVAELTRKKSSVQVQDPEDMGLIIREVVAHESGIKKVNPHAFEGLITVGKDC